MTVSLPRIQITVGANSEGQTQAELTMLSVGFGIQQAWFFSVVFGLIHVFGGSLSPQLHTGIFITLSVVTAACLFVAAITDQRFLHLYTAKASLVAAAVLAAAGTALVFPAILVSEGFGLVAFLAALGAGIGSSFLSLFWGVAFSRQDAGTIVLNTAVGMVIALAIYAIALHIPDPFDGLVVMALPLLELPFLWKFTPVSYAVQHSVPIFNPLPVARLRFFPRLGIPMLLFGFIHGILSYATMQVILPEASTVLLLLALFAGGGVTVVLLVAAFSMNPNSHWDAFFRLLIPVVAFSLFFLPLLGDIQGTVVPLLVLVGYLCFEALLWIFLAELPQEFRPSPILVFGMGRGAMVVGMMLSGICLLAPDLISLELPDNQFAVVAALLVLLFIANALRPHVRDIKQVITPKRWRRNNAISVINRTADSISWNDRREAAPALSTSTEAIPIAAEPVVAPTTPKPVSGWRTASYGVYSQQLAEAAVAAEKSRAIEAAEAPAPAPKPKPEPAAPAVEPEVAEDDTKPRKAGRFRLQCEVIADRYLLSRRETEVLFLLAKGHNASYIQDKLCVSLSTAKTHISHIYRKLDIHSQQELLNMVEEVRDEMDRRN